MATTQHRSDDDRHHCTPTLLENSAPFDGILATAISRLAIGNSANSLSQPICTKPASSGLRDGSGNVGILPICNDFRIDTSRATKDDASLLANLLGSGWNSLSIDALLKHFGDLPRLLLADFAELVSVTGSFSDATVLKAVRQSAMRLLDLDDSEARTLDNSESLVRYLTGSMAGLRVETFRVIFLDTHNSILADETMWTGTVNDVQVHPREVMRRALELDCSALVMAHNHPSQVHKPSLADITMTKRIMESARTLGLIVHDHIIISRRGYHSMRSHKSIDPWE